MLNRKKANVYGGMLLMISVITLPGAVLSKKAEVTAASSPAMTADDFTNARNTEKTESKSLFEGVSFTEEYEKCQEIAKAKQLEKENKAREKRAKEEKIKLKQEQVRKQKEKKEEEARKQQEGTDAARQQGEEANGKEPQAMMAEEVQKQQDETQAQEDVSAASAETAAINPYGGIVLSEEDHVALERIVQAEAGGENEQGKILVAQVVLNRVLNENFADTPYDVVFERIGGSAQFSPTVDGRYYSVTVTEESKDAVQKAITGEDLSQGALYFSARSKANPNSMQWFDRNLKRLFQLGGHEFFTLP